MTGKLETADAIARSNRTDLYLGVIAPVGVRRDSFLNQLKRALSGFGYRVEVVRLSDLLEDFQGVVIDRSSENSRLESAMTAGSALRMKFGSDVLARAAMIKVSKARAALDDPLPPTAYVFWSLKHPEEVATLRMVYGAGFHLIGLFSAEDDRIAALEEREGITESHARAHVERDRDEAGKGHGQRTRDTFHRADVFLRWSNPPDEAALERFMDILFGRPDSTPTADEQRMFLAYAAALRSGELARQVGAVLVSSDGDLVAVGANDVPRRGGGQYWPGPDDDRDAVPARGEDSNTSMRRQLLERVATELVETLGLSDASAVTNALERSRLKEITEYGRAVHAEMEALLGCARSGRTTRKTTLYVTTYPCHNCARHLIAAGVERVVFVEPYPKSRALELHDKDVVEVAPGTPDANGRVCFEPYLGIGPRRFFDYFSMTLGDGYELQRKDDQGRLAAWDRKSAAPRVQLSSMTVQDLETSLGAPLVDHLGEEP